MANGERDIKASIGRRYQPISSDPGVILGTAGRCNDMLKRITDPGLIGRGAFSDVILNGLTRLIRFLMSLPENEVYQRA